MIKHVSIIDHTSAVWVCIPFVMSITSIIKSIICAPDGIK